LTLQYPLDFASCPIDVTALQINAHELRNAALAIMGSHQVDKLPSFHTVHLNENLAEREILL
jgi:hypothetical protein